MTEELKIRITAQVDKLKQGVNEAKKAVEKFTDGAEKGASEMDEAFKSAGDSIKNSLANAAKIGAATIAGLGAALVGANAATQEYRQNQAQLNAAFEQAGFSASSASNAYNDLYKIIGESDQATESAANIAMLANSEEEVAKWAELASGVLGTFHDTLQPEAFYEAANETMKLGEATGAFTQMLEQTGVMSVDDFNKKLSECNTETEKQNLMLQVSQKAMGTAGESYNKATANIQKQREAQEKLTSALAKVGEAMAPVITSFTEFAANALAVAVPYIQQIAEKYGPTLKEVLSTAAGYVKEIVGFVVDNWEIIASIAGVIGGIATAIGIYNTVAAIKAAMAAAEVTTVWALVAAYAAQAAAMIVAIAPYLLIVAAIAAVIAIIVLCVKHWDEIKEAIGKVMDWIAEKIKERVDKIVNFFKALWEGIKIVVGWIVDGIKERFNKIKETITTIIEGVKTVVLTVFNFIKDGITTRINTIKTVVTTVFNAIKTAITKPIETAKGIIKGIVDAIKGFFNFKVELPKIKLPHFSIKPKGWKIGDLMDGSIPKLGIEWYAKGGVFEKPTIFGMNGNRAMVGGEAGAEAIVPLERNTKWLDKIADKLAGSTNRPVVLNVDGKVFAQTSINTINELTRQTGSLKLNIM